MPLALSAVRAVLALLSHHTVRLLPRSAAHPAGRARQADNEMEKALRAWESCKLAAQQRQRDRTAEPRRRRGGPSAYDLTADSDDSDDPGEEYTAYNRGGRGR